VKISEVLQALQGLEALQAELSEHDERLPAGVAFKLARINRQLTAEHGVYEEQRGELVKQFGELDEEQQLWTVTQENVDAYRKENQELLDTDIKLDIDPVPVSEFGEHLFSLQVMSALLPILAEAQ
jgi:hypothetical protein